MAQETFSSPDVYEREIDNSVNSPQGPSGTPAAVVGTSRKGPAFVPVTVGNFDEFKQTFGGVDNTMYGPYAAQQWLTHRSALTYLRVLGAGANETDGQILTTQTTGRVRNAGVKFVGSVAPHDSRGRHNGAVQFLVARHTTTANEAFGMPLFTDNDTFASSEVNLVRGMIMLASGSRLIVIDGSGEANNFTAAGHDDTATLSGGKFKLVISSTLGDAFARTDNTAGVRILTASFDPTSTDYFAKVLNSDPDRFATDQHYLFADFAVDSELAAATQVAILSGTANVSNNSGEPALAYRDAFGAFDTRFKVPTSPSIISQPFGNTEYDLFRFEALDDGAYANTLYKISISSVKASVDDSQPYGSFTVEVRDFNDTDTNPRVLERFPLCSLDPKSASYVGKLIGDRHVTYNFDATVEGERRVVAFGKYANVSKYVRVVPSNSVEKALVPKDALPFGFRGMGLLKTNNTLGDRTDQLTAASVRIGGVLGLGGIASSLSGSVVPPIPFRYKVTKGATASPAVWPGQPGATELTNTPLYWGVKFERNTDPLNANVTSEKNEILSTYAKFLGIKELDTLLTGSGADIFNNNKFTLAKVTLSNASITHLTSSASDHMREAAYIRNGTMDPSNYTINDGVLGARVTLATVLAKDTAANFNKFSPFAKFTTFLCGGYDGLNFLDRDNRRMNDRSTSFDAAGGAEANYVSPGLLVNANGTGQSNSNVVSYKTAAKIMTDKQSMNHNALFVPGIREQFLTDTFANAVRDYGMAFYVMDVPPYTDQSVRLYDNDNTAPDVERTVSLFDSQVLDNSYAGAYFPDVFIDDAANKRRVKVPASVAVASAFAFNDRVGYPWFAPAGFNRAALDFVKNVTVRLNANDRNRLYDSRINPIATFPRQGFVIYGQKTLQLNPSALDRVNVRRMLLEVKRIIIGIGNALVFENNTAEVRNRFVGQASIQLGLIQGQAGVNKFQVVMNETNNTQEDKNLNRLRGKVVVVPTRTIEFISLDFVIDNNGTQFV
jgi:hypothetical protein